MEMLMEVRLCAEGAERKLVDEFCRKVFASPQGITGESPSERPRRNPYQVGAAPTAIAIHDGAIVGHLASTPYALWINGQVRMAHWGSGRYVLPEFRGMGLAKKLDACVTKEMPLLSGVFVIEAALRSHKADNWVFPGKIVEYIHVVNPHRFLSLLTVERLDRFLPKKMKPAANVALRMLRKPIGLGIKTIHQFKGIPAKARRGKECRFVDVAEFGPDVDQLWEKTKESFTLTNVRNAEYMNWQFPASRGWRKMVYTKSNEVRAWALYTIMTYKDGGPLDGLKSLNIIDALWSHTEPDVLKDLVNHVLFRGYNEGVDIIMFSGNHSGLATILKKSAFIRIPSTVWVAFRSENKADDFDQLYANSYITRGYADAAGGLGPL
jgi:hypothetical protein